jgi:hypothetical protein
MRVTAFLILSTLALWKWCSNFRCHPCRVAAFPHRGDARCRTGAPGAGKHKTEMVRKGSRRLILPVSRILRAVATGSVDPARRDHGCRGIQPRSRVASLLFHSLRRSLYCLSSSFDLILKPYSDPDRQRLSVSEYGRAILRAGLFCDIDTWQQ